MPPPTQIVRTSRTAFGLTVAGAFVATTWTLTDVIWEQRTIWGAIEFGFPFLVGGCLVAIFGAAIGGLLALMCGANLSRQYCWLFSLAGGLVLVPTLAISLWHTLSFFPQTTSGWLTGNGVMMSYWAVLGICIVGSILLGVRLVRTCVGLTKRSRRAAWIGLLYGGLAAGVMQWSWYLLAHNRRVLAQAASAGANVPIKFDAGIMWMLSCYTIFVFTSFAAALYSKRYESPRFEVVMG